MTKDLVEPEGVNAGSAGEPRDGADLVSGGDATAAAGQERPKPTDGVLGAPPDPAENTDEIFGSTAG